jgi:isopenicillin N synthase-like dioxygenase
VTACLQRWPDADVPDFKRILVDFFMTSVRLSDRVMSAIARGLHLPVGTYTRHTCFFG